MVKCLASIHSTVDYAFALEGASEWKMEVVDSIPTTGKTNQEDLQQLNTCNWSWLTELEQSTAVDQIKGSVRDSVRTPEFQMKYLMTEGHISRNVVIITVKGMLIIRIFLNNNND